MPVPEYPAPDHFDFMVESWRERDGVFNMDAYTRASKGQGGRSFPHEPVIAEWIAKNYGTLLATREDRDVLDLKISDEVAGQQSPIIRLFTAEELDGALRMGGDVGIGRARAIRQIHQTETGLWAVKTDGSFQGGPLGVVQDCPSELVDNKDLTLRLVPRDQEAFMPRKGVARLNEEIGQQENVQDSRPITLDLEFDYPDETRNVLPDLGAPLSLFARKGYEASRGFGVTVEMDRIEKEGAGTGVAAWFAQEVRGRVIRLAHGNGSLSTEVGGRQLRLVLSRNTQNQPFSVRFTTY